MEERGSRIREEVAHVVWTVRKRPYGVAIHVHGLQWEQSHMYAGCNGNSCVCTRVPVRTVINQVALGEFPASCKRLNIFMFKIQSSEVQPVIKTNLFTFP